MRKTQSGGRGRIVAFAAIGAVAAPLAISGMATAAPDLQQGEKQTYIVQLQDKPLAGYTGGTEGIPATKPGVGDKIDTESSAADRYNAYLSGERSAALDAVGLSASAVSYEYTVAFNGFSAKMTANQAAALRKTPGVVNIWENEVRTADTVHTPEFLGLTGADGVWEQQFSGPENAGDGIVVGIIDTGLWPENPSFADLPGNPAPPAGWAGVCETGTEPDPADNFTCNSKVIGARDYPEDNTVGPDFLSPRDYNGHGSHTAGTAAGNYDTPAEIGGVPVGNASGMAPAAQIAVYKGLYQTPAGTGSGSTSGLVKAIDDAVADGVDVINYSISGSSVYVVTPDEISFLFAADAGVFVSTSAGNSGDTVGKSSVAHNSPWTMTVAASTKDTNYNKYVELEPMEQVRRIFGPDRYATAAALSEEYPDGVDTVYIATGSKYADALAGASAAANGLSPATGANQTDKNGAATTPTGEAAPVLLVRQDSIPTATADALSALDPETIVVLGGTSTVSAGVAAELAAWGEVSRVSGKDRYHTAALLAEQFGTAEKVYVASGEEGAFADALTGAALAGSERAPVLLTRQGSVPPSVTEVLAALGDPEVIVLGGKSRVSQAVYDQLGASKRINGADRYETSAMIAEEFGYDGDAPGAYLATGIDYPDSLTASALAGSEDSPVLLTKRDMVPTSVMDQLMAMDPAMITIVGGYSKVSQAVEDALRAAFPGTNAGRFDGIGVGEAVGPAPLTDSEDIPAAGHTAADARLCFPDSIDPAQAAGKIVICTRGTNDRVEKSETVDLAGGIGMILVNTSDAQSLNADFHSVPTIHVNATDGAAIKAYEDTDPTPTAYISADGQGEVIAPEMAGFSSYGPALAGGGDLLKPDITAPGVDIIAPVAPPGNNGENWFAYSGTSMSAPHIAGLAALMMQRYPDISVAGVKSMMMTTATPLNNAGGVIEYAGAPANPLHFGAGHVRPGLSYGVGAIYDAGFNDWLLYACAIGQLQLVGGTCPAVVPDASDLNYPSIAIGDLAGSQTVTRTLTNVTGSALSYTASVEAPPGTTAVVSPAVLNIPAGGDATFEVTITTTTAAADEYTFGALSWTGSGGDVLRSPIAVQPISFSAPAEVTATGTSGDTEIDVLAGYNGVMNADVDGLVKSEAQNKAVAPAADTTYTFTVPAGLTVARFQTFQDETNIADLDLVVRRGATVVGSSAGGDSNEVVTLDNPVAGTYVVTVDNFSGEADGEATVHGFNLTATAAGNMTVDPTTTPVVTGETVTFTAAWTGLDADARYLGAVNFSDATDSLGRTLVSVNTNP